MAGVDGMGPELRKWAGVGGLMTVGLRPGEIEQGYIGEVLEAFEDDFAAVGGNIEVANVEVGRKVGQLAFGACVEIDEPEIFVLNFSA